MEFTNNDSVEKRTLDKELGLIKHQLKARLGSETVNVQIMCRKQTVVVSGETVAKVGSNGEIEYMGEVNGPGQ